VGPRNKIIEEVRKDEKKRRVVWGVGR